MMQMLWPLAFIAIIFFNRARVRRLLRAGGICLFIYRVFFKRRKPAKRIAEERQLS